MLSFKIFFTNRRFFAPAFLYACFSLIFSTWVTYIPYIADKLDITEGKIGGAILFIAMGSLTMLFFSRRLVEKVGAGRMAFTGFVLYAIALYGLFLAPTYGLLCVALFLFGNMSSIFAISINSLTASIEKQSGMYIMTGSHGFWSIGGIIGASTGSFIAGLLRMPLLHISILVAILITIQFFLRKEYWHIRTEPHVKEKHTKFPLKPLIGIASIGLVVMVSEGAIADWSALYLKKVVGMKVQYLGLGYALFATGMAIGRFSGDAISRKIGSWRMIRLAIGTAIVGFILLLLKQPLITLTGFVVIGLGFSTVVPEVYRLASMLKGIRTSDGVSFISGTANVGFMTGPVALGFIAELHTLHLSFMVLTALITVAWITTFRRH
jgi:predicted MFS family arabinose efflux permease